MAPAPVTLLDHFEETLETHDVQGLVLRGYGILTAAQFQLLEIDQVERARAYLRGLVGRLDLAATETKDTAVQVAFSARGLERLGVPASALATFSREFLEGMDEDIRSDVLGDRGDNDPSTWRWGRRTEPIHVLLMLYAVDDDRLNDLVTAESEAYGDAFHLRHAKATQKLDQYKEHFGWRDGLSMPKFAGVPPERPRKKKQESWTHPLRPGEFVLGYPNDYNAFTESPTVDPAHDPQNLLPREREGTRKSLGRNGTYLVFREMTQDVRRFWSHLAEHSREPGADPAARAIALGAKMVGRWPGGAPLVTSPDGDREHHANDNEFLYAGDKLGLRCPPGAHIRRSNPRDILSAPGDRSHEASIAMVRKHQMIRRGRTFGPPVAESMDPRDILATPPDGQERGLHFICLVGDIARQFEFVQRAWIHSANFAALCKDGDPIAAARRPQGDENPNDELTVPAEPLRRKYKQLPQFTRLVGGGYFFLPGIAALRFIAREP